MSYQTGTATGPADLMSKLNTFLTGTPGWTAELFSSGNSRAIWSKAGVSTPIFAYWDTDNIALAMIQQAASPLDQALTAQGGAEYASSTITSNRYCNVMPGPYPSYHFFEDDDYIHVVVEKSSGIYRHFGFGQTLKLGSWTGGTYVYCHYWQQAVATIDNPNSLLHVAAMSGGAVSNNTRGPGVHAEGLPDQGVGSKYLRMSTSTSMVDDDADPIGNFFPAGWYDGQNIHFMAAQSSDLNEFKPLIPIPLYQWHFSTPDNARLLGYVPDHRSINLYGLNVAQEVTVGSDTWAVFPITRKGNSGLALDLEQSYNFGLAYRKVTT